MCQFGGCCNSLSVCSEIQILVSATGPGSPAGRFFTNSSSLAAKHKQQSCSLDCQLRVSVNINGVFDAGGDVFFMTAQCISNVGDKHVCR